MSVCGSVCGISYWLVGVKEVYIMFYTMRDISLYSQRTEINVLVKMCEGCKEGERERKKERIA